MADGKSWREVREQLALNETRVATYKRLMDAQEEIRIDLERPRTPDIALSERYGALDRRVRRLIRRIIQQPVQQRQSRSLLAAALFSGD